MTTASRCLKKRRPVGVRLGVDFLTFSRVMSGLKPQKEWMVWPRTLRAATPVGARTAIFLRVVSRKYSRSVDFPVPAFPVMKTWRSVFSIRSRARRNWSLISIWPARGHGRNRRSR